MGGGTYSFNTIPALVAAGKLPMQVVDTAVSRLLKAKFEMGLFENPYTGVEGDKAATLIHTPEIVALARQLDTESIVLLENHNDILPLKKSTNVAVIGPMAHGFMNVSTAFGIANSYLLTTSSTEIMSSMKLNTTV